MNGTGCEGGNSTNWLINWPSFQKDNFSKSQIYHQSADKLFNLPVYVNLRTQEDENAQVLQHRPDLLTLQTKRINHLQIGRNLTGSGIKRSRSQNNVEVQEERVRRLRQD
eukprot:TRINITY_DN10276_c0_g2_i4.p1 TRINITY_DN10276_c0_g2~~TRINITY_DN10276_c0_g2_i4.p1  ORF type:complete len:110 (-),score=4.40 TRINITY_DN10276_c0_g2_i4:253-582(-)